MKKILKNVALFMSLGDAELEKISKYFILQKVNKGEIIFLQNQPCLGFYIVETGLVKIFKISSEGREQILEIIKPGDYFGLIPVLDGGSYPASAMAKEDSVILMIKKDDFINIIKMDSTLSLKMLSSMSKRMRAFSAMIEDLSLKNVRCRLAAFINQIIIERGKDMDSKITLEIDMTHEEIANKLGTVREIVTKNISRFQKEGIIKVEGKKMAILDKRRIEEISWGV